MSQNRHASLRVAIPALSLLCVSGLLFAGGAQQPGQIIKGQQPFRVFTVEVDEPEPPRLVNDADCSFLQDPARYLETPEIQNAKRTAQIGGIIPWTLYLNGTSTGIT